jgi:uroporphyrinogen decarboxylase
MDKRLVLALQGNQTDRVPFWFMRQAGRSLPEYRALREKNKNFLEFCYTPDAASEATLQPIRRFGMDGAVIFSDILVVPHALGVDVHFEEGVGPLLTPLRDETALEKLKPENLKKKLAPVYETLRLTKKNLPKETALIGFVGAPWTLACYIIEGRSSKDFSSLKQLAKTEHVFFEKLIDLLTESVSLHAINQIESGAEIIQLFDSWAGMANEEEYSRWIIAPAKKIVKKIKTIYPNVPIIGFPRQSGNKYESYAKETGVDAVSVDQTVPLSWIRSHLQPLCRVQGCLNNELLADNKQGALAEAKTLLTTLDKPFVFNLAHGILPHTPVENIQALCDLLKRV